MIPKRRSDHGQVLVIVAFGMFALLGMAALAIDGGNAYSDRRHAQNAADTAALAAGLTFVRNPDQWSVAHDAGMTRASDNGYDNNGTTNEVAVYRCNEAGATCHLPSPLPPLPSGDPDLSAYYIQASITSHVPTYLARVLGVTQVTNAVQAVVHSVPPRLQERYNGAALVALQPGCKNPPSVPDDPFTLGGTGDIVVNASGVFVNSNCNNAFTSSNNTTLTTPDAITCVVGTVNANGVVEPPAQPNCSGAVDPQAFKAPPVDLTSCTTPPAPGAGTITDLGVLPGDTRHTYLATPGYYDSTFPPNLSGTLRLGTGIYCLKNGISVNSTLDLTTDLGDGGAFDGSDTALEGVLLYVPTGSVTFNGSSHVTIGAMNNVSISPSLRGYLLYVPPTNNSPVKIAGSNGSQFVGTILAPASLITMEGGSNTDSLSLECQIIGFSIKLTGNGLLDITYHGGQVGKAYTNPILELYR